MQFPLLDISSRDPATTWGAIAVGVLTIVYVVFIRPLRKKKDPLARPKGDAGANLARQRSVERDMSNLLVELSEMTRQLTAQLDTRAAKLEILLREADEKLAALRAEAGRSPEGVGQHELSLRHSVDRGFHPPAQDHHDRLLLSNTAVSSTALAETDRRHAAIYEMADEGHNAHEIARQLDRPSGEIELILALRSGR
ncbi:MAG TPA: hypothetical protein VFB66_15875 [Tepidisphaeraceae bacterium]|nr:hypothetical protein [Tepidisphaeraceae bacterium]